MRPYELKTRPVGDCERTRRAPMYTIAEACQALNVPENMHRYVGGKAHSALTPNYLPRSKLPRYPLAQLKALLIKEGILK